MPKRRVRNMPRHQQRAVFAKLRNKRTWKTPIRAKVPGPYGTSVTFKQTPKTRELKVSSPGDVLSAGLKQQTRGLKASTIGYLEADYIIRKKRITKKL